MGCGLSSAHRVELQHQYEEAQRSTVDLKKQLQERERQLKSVREGGAEASGSKPAVSIDQLRAELEARQLEFNDEFQRNRTELDKQFEQLQHGALEDRERCTSQSSTDSGSPRQSSLQARGTPKAPLSERDYVRHLEAAAARRHREEAESAEKQLRALLEELAPLQKEHDQAAEDLEEARLQIRVEKEGRKSSTTVANSLERNLAEARSEHARAEQRWQDLERHLQEQMKEMRGELYLRANELRARDKHLHDRDKELGEVNGQLADLQSLFDDVNQQLQTECGRIEQLQETVALCAKQGKELEALQGMLEESHRVLAQMRDALEFERSERSKAGELLEHEQQRTQLLLDVLKHFKEKLQGLTPQMLLNRLGASGAGDIKALLGNGAGMTNGSSNGVAVKGTTVHCRQGVYTESPRWSASEGAASTIAPESSSMAPWVNSVGGSAVGMTASAGRTPSPVPSRLAPSPSLAPASDLPSLWQPGAPGGQRSGGGMEASAGSSTAAPAGPNFPTIIGHSDQGTEAMKAYGNARTSFGRN